MTIQSIEQKRAKYALDKVKNFTELDGVDGAKKEKWKARVNQMPAMIQMNGLGQTAAFYLSKGDKHLHKNIYDVLQGWLLSTDANVFPEQQECLMTCITQHNMATYRLAQAEAQAMLAWLKKFSNAYCKD